MGVRNFLVEGVSGTGKTTVCDELNRRGVHAIHGDRELADQGDPVTGEPTVGVTHENHIWDTDRVHALAAQQDEAVTFFSGGSRNHALFIDVFDAVFVLEVDLDTLVHRLDSRTTNDWGATSAERDLVVSLHASRQDIPDGGIGIDATRPVGQVVDRILRITGIDETGRGA